MSATAEAGQSGSGSGSSPEDTNPQVESTTTTSDGKPPEKTISCTSCRKRKLKCDRVKPSCGTCSRLRHDCEYPERRRNLGSKRRNMKELEARLGMPLLHLSLCTMSDHTQRKSKPNWSPRRKQRRRQRRKQLRKFIHRQTHPWRQTGTPLVWIWIWTWT